jgi:hypothetical protein
MSETLCITPAEDDEKEILRRLLRLVLCKEDDEENIPNVEMNGCVNEEYEQVPFTESMVSDIVQTFRHISSKGIVWDRLHLDKCDQADPQFQALLSQILKLDLFREIAFAQSLMMVVVN